MQSKIIDPTLGELTLSQTRRAKRLTITVSGSGALRVSYPVGISTKRALEFLNSRRDWIIASQARLLARQVPQPQHDMEELRRKAQVHLPQRVASIAAAMGLHYNKLTIRAARTKWGSCTSRGAISLSLYVMILPQHLIDFIIIHELCHTVHLNHSAEFHALVNMHTNNRERELDAELRRYAAR